MSKNNQLASYKQQAMITIKDGDVLFYRFTAWENISRLKKEIDTKRSFMVGDEMFASRDFVKAEKHNGEVLSGKLLEIVNQKILKYKTTFHTNPSSSQINIFVEAAKKIISN